MSYTAGGQCWPTVEEAAQAACTAAAGVSSSGVVSCDGVQSVGEGSAVLLLRYSTSSGSTVVQTGYVLPPCEYPSFSSFWGPVLAAAFVALVTVRAAMVLPSLFKRESL